MHDSRRIEHAAAEWLARRDRDDWSARDERAFEDWLEASTRHRVEFLRVQAAWREAGRLQALAAGLPGGTVPPRGAWTIGALVPATYVRAARGTQPARRWRYALAAGFALVATGSALWFGWQLGGRSEADYASMLGQVQAVTLADGSNVVLSSNSRLHVRMTRGERDVELLEGEAYFDVAHDAGRPFVVSSGGRRATAVGTRFSVRSDAQDVRVVVTEGKVRFDAPPGADGRATPVSLLPAGSVATAGRNGVFVRSLPVAEAERYLEWRSGFLTFDDTSLANAAAEFNRFNTRKLELADAAIGDLRVGGNFRWANVDSFVKLLEMGFPVRAERLPDRTVLHAR